MKIFTNGEFISCEKENKVFSNMIVNKGKIIYTGDSIPEQYKDAEKIDLQGKCVIPAFADTHIHFSSYALFLSTLDVRDVADFDELGKMVKEYIRKHPKEKFIPAFGCSAHTVKEQRLPERKDLDKITDIPFMIVKYDGHAGVANTAFINKLPEEVKNDPGYDAETGWLNQNAFYIGVNYMSSQSSPLKVAESLVKASDFMAKRGIALIHPVEGVGYKNDLDVDAMKFVTKGLPQAFRIFFQTTDVDAVLKRKLPRVGGCFRLALDGCFGSEDAALSEPYCTDPNNKGFLLYTQEEVNDFCIRANREGLQISMHAIGDVAVDQALTAYEKALEDCPRKDHRHTIIHADLIPEDMQQRAANMGICVAAQPAFLYWDQEPEVYLKKILGDRADELIPLRSLVEKGIVISGGSDAPCTIPNPIQSIHFSCNHPNPNESLTVLDALRMHTSWASYMSFDENTRGTLKNGLIADFVVLSENPLNTPVEKLKDIKVEDTYFGGDKYQTPDSSVVKLLARALVTKAR